MKITVENHIIKALPESIDEVKKLIDLATPKKVFKKRKVGNKRICEICGKYSKGLMGLGIHKRKAHGIRSGEPVAEKVKVIVK